MVCRFRHDVRLEPYLLEKRQAIVVETGVEPSFEPRRTVRRARSSKPVRTYTVFWPGDGRQARDDERLLAQGLGSQTFDFRVQTDKSRVHCAILNLPNQIDRMLAFDGNSPAWESGLPPQFIENIGESASVEYRRIAHDELAAVGIPCRSPGHGDRLLRSACASVRPDLGQKRSSSRAQHHPRFATQKQLDAEGVF